MGNGRAVRGGCYVRVSTEHQLENYSIEEQTDRLKAYCLAKDIQIVRFYTDGGYSGGNTRRPALKRMLADIEAGLLDIVVVYRLDRLSRSQKDTLMLIEDKFMAHQVDFISVSENFDTTTPFGRAMIGILSVFAQLEKDQITERFTMGRIGRAKNGLYHGGPTAPTGYDYVEGRLVVNGYAALQVRDLFERFAAGYSLHSCWLYMREKYGGWSSETLVRKVLKNEVYKGMVKFNGVSYPGVHEPLVSGELFDAVQNIFARSGRRASFGHPPFQANTLLSGLIYCGKCGARYHGEHGNYSCYSRTRSDPKYVADPGCRNRKWKIEELDARIVSCLLRLRFEETPEKERPAARRDYSKRLKEIDRQTAALIDLYQTGTVPLETVSERVRLLTKEKETLLKEGRKPEANPDIGEAGEENRLSFQERLLRMLETGPLPEKRACLAGLIDRIVINEGSMDIILR